MARERPIGVTILAIVAIIAAVNAFIVTLQMLHLLPTYLGPIAFYQFSLIGATNMGVHCLHMAGYSRGAVDSPSIGMVVDGADCRV